MQIIVPIYDYVSKRDKESIKKVEIPLIEMEIVGSLIEPYFHASN
jgi:hypothetical protein